MLVGFFVVVVCFGVGFFVVVVLFGVGFFFLEGVGGGGR